MRFILLMLTCTAAVHAVNCRCRRSNFEVEFVKDECRSTPFARAVVMGRKLNDDKTRVKYTLYVEQVYADCVEKLPRVQLAYSSAGPCGANLEIHREYVLPLRKDGAASKISKCMMAVRVDRLQPRHSYYLQTRPIRKCSGKLTCAWGQMPYECSHATINRPRKPCNRAKQWVINECDGCRAEWFTWTGFPACVGEPDAHVGSSRINPYGGKRMMVKAVLSRLPKSITTTSTASEPALAKQSKTLSDVIAEERSKVSDENAEDLGKTDSEDVANGEHEIAVEGGSSASWGGMEMGETTNHEADSDSKHREKEVANSGEKDGLKVGLSKNTEMHGNIRRSLVEAVMTDNTVFRKAV